MMFAKFSLLALAAPALAVTREECKEDSLPPLLECIDSFTGTPQCDYLPIPDFAMPQNEANEMGYWIQQLRNTPTSHVFAVSENTYSSMIIVDVPPAESVSKGGGGRLRGLQDEDEEGLLIDGPQEDSLEERLVEADGISVAFVDFPPTFLQYDAQGQPAGSHLISALDDILNILEATTEDVAKIELIYTHGHKDHIGLANHTYTYVTDTLGFDPADVPVIAPEGVKKHFEHAIDMGLWTYSAPVPTDTFEDMANHTVGYSTDLTMTTIQGHSAGDNDVVVFMEALDEENPAIMMVVDIVFPKWVPFFSFAISTDLLQYIAAHDVLLEFPLGDDGYLVGGHLTQVGDRNDIFLNQELTNAIVTAAGEALQEVDVMAIVGATGAFTPGEPNFGNSWAGFGAYFDELERVCARKVLAEYGCDFGALDVTLYSSCRMAQSFWRIDV